MLNHFAHLLTSKISLWIVFAFIGLASSFAFAQGSLNEQLILTARYSNGNIAPYLLTTNDLINARYAVILMPGGAGIFNPRIEDGKLRFKSAGNFVIRSRGLFADSETVATSTDATYSQERMRAIVQDLKYRYPNVTIYIVGTSNSTRSTMLLGERMDGEVGGFIHTASLNIIGGYDTQSFKSRHLIVHHTDDGCHLTGFWEAKRNHEKYKTFLIAMSGGQNIGDPCFAQAHHGFNGIEKDTVEKIKLWMKSNGSR
jgi:hypothetical protein